MDLKGGKDEMRPSRRALAVMLLVCACGLTSTVSPTRAADPFSFTSIDVPGATDTYAQGATDAQGVIENRATAEQIVGYCTDARGQLHAFFRITTGAFTIIDVRDADNTFATGSNGAGQIVGFFYVYGGKVHGYLRTSTGAVTRIDVSGAGARDTGAFGINSDGQIVGIFADAGGREHGFVTTR